MHASADVARVAGEVAAGFALRTLAIEAKSDGSPVTEADRAAERAAREWIQVRFPSYGVAGEEYGIERAEAPRRWIIDPIDGTKSFVRGVPLWGTLVALLEGDRVLAGAVRLANGDVLCAAPGCGAWWNGERCRVSAVATVPEALVLTSDDSFRDSPSERQQWERVRQRAAMSRTWGDCYGYCLVATGRAEAMADPKMSIWDAACFVPIIEEAGGVVTRWDGSSGAFAGSLVATNSAIAAEIRSLLRDPWNPNDDEGR